MNNNLFYLITNKAGLEMVINQNLTSQMSTFLMVINKIIPYNIITVKAVIVALALMETIPILVVAIRQDPIIIKTSQEIILHLNLVININIIYFRQIIINVLWKQSTTKWKSNLPNY